MKIYKLCHVAFYEFERNDHACAPDFLNDVKVFTSKRRAIKCALMSVGAWRDIMGYKVTEADFGYMRSWVLESTNFRRGIHVIEDETL